jgi:hypothetical protein
MSAFPITLLDNPRQNFTLFYAQVISAYGSECRGILQHGLLGYIVNDTLWSQLPDNLEDDGTGTLIPKERPTIHLTLRNLSATATSVQVKKWQTKDANRTKVIDTLLTLKQNFIACLGPADQSILSHPIFGLMNITPQVILAHLVTIYGQLDNADILRLEQQLDAKMLSTEAFETVAGRHKVIHDQLHYAGQGRPENLKIRLLRNATYHVPAIKMATDSYHTAHPLVVNQNFTGLVAHITAQAPNFSPTMTSLGYNSSSSADPLAVAYQALIARLDSLSVSATHNPSPAAPSALPDNSVVALAAVGAAADVRSQRGGGGRGNTTARSVNRGGGSGRRSSGNTRRRTPAREYCYLHGYDASHSGAYCDNMVTFPLEKRVATTHDQVAGGSIRNL